MIRSPAPSTVTLADEESISIHQARPYRPAARKCGSPVQAPNS
jgi:hypothetical protein